jgi:prepilin-type N-terminal cleavage/methylation domain-containing protein
MKERSNTYRQKAGRTGGERGVSIVEMLIVVAMIGIVTAFAVMKIGGAQRAMRLSNSARELTSWLEKTRLDSVRRHAMANTEMASVTIASANSYTVTIDQDGDGVLDPARTITIPATHGATFSGITVPVTIYYDWRGRAVDSSGNPLNLSFSLSDYGGVNNNPIVLTSTGDASLGNATNTSNVSISAVSNTANIKATTTYGP